MTNDRPGPPHSEFFRRLRARPLSSWSVGQRTDQAWAAIQRLSGLGWTSDEPPPLVPDLGVHVLADQLEVLLDDAVAAGADRAVVHSVIAELADQLGIRLD